MKAFTERPPNHTPSARANPLLHLREFGQVVWLGFLRRGLRSSGQLQSLITQDGVCGATTNPSVLEKVIGGSHDYDEAIQDLVLHAGDAKEAYETLIVEDVRQACEAFRDVYEATGGREGFVSLDLPPHVAHDTSRTIAEAQRLWTAVARPNMMVKLPATYESLPAIEQLTREGIHLHVTRLFGIDRYRQVVTAYIRGLESRRATGLPVAGITSSAGFLLSRIDVLADVYYLDALIGPATIAIVTSETLAAYRDHGNPASRLQEGIAEAEDVLQRLAELQIDIGQVNQQLRDEAIARLFDPFDRLIETLQEKREALAGPSRQEQPPALARRQGFRRVFLDFPDVPPRYAAMSHVGLVPAALMGLDIEELLARALRMAYACTDSVPLKENPGICLAAALAQLALQDQGQLSLILPPSLWAFGRWVSNLLTHGLGMKYVHTIRGDASSSVLPADGVHPQLSIAYAFAATQDGGAGNPNLSALRERGEPLILLGMKDRFDLGQEIFRWQMGVATAGHLLGINPFSKGNPELEPLQNEDNDGDR